MINVVSISAIGIDNQIPFIPKLGGIIMKHIIGRIPLIIVKNNARQIF